MSNKCWGRVWRCGSCLSPQHKRPNWESETDGGVHCTFWLGRLFATSPFALHSPAEPTNGFLELFWHTQFGLLVISERLATGARRFNRQPAPQPIFRAAPSTTGTQIIYRRLKDGCGVIALFAHYLRSLPVLRHCGLFPCNFDLAEAFPVSPWSCFHS